MVGHNMHHGRDKWTIQSICMVYVTDKLVRDIKEFAPATYTWSWNYTKYIEILVPSTYTIQRQWEYTT